MVVVAMVVGPGCTLVVGAVDCVVVVVDVVEVVEVGVGVHVLFDFSGCVCHVTYT